MKFETPADWENPGPLGGSDVARGFQGLNLAAKGLGAFGSMGGSMGGMAGGLAGGAAGLASAYSLAQAVQNQDPVGIAAGLAGIYGGGVALANQFLNAGLPTLTSLAANAITSVAPQLASSLATWGTTAVGGAAGAATGAATQAISAGVGAAIGGVAAAVGPLIQAAFAYMGEEDRRNMIEKLRQMNQRNTATAYEGGVQSANDLTSQIREILPVLSPQGQQAFVNSAEKLLAPSNQQDSSALSPRPFSPLESIATMRYGNAGPQTMPGTDTTFASNAEVASKPFTELYRDLAYVLQQNPNLAIPSYDAHKTADINQTMALLNGQGGAAMPGDYQGYYSQLPGLPQPFIEKLEATGQEGSPYNSTLVANPELGGQFSPEVLGSPFFAQEYWQSKGVTPQQAMLYSLGQNVESAQHGTAPYMQQNGLNTTTPEFLQQNYSPDAIYKYLTTQGGLSPINQPIPQAGGGLNVGPGAEQQGVGNVAAGRISPPNAVTGLAQMPRPEADARTQATFGMRRPLATGMGSDSTPPPPPVPGTSAAEPKPFGMGGGFAVAPGGNIGTGGVRTAQPFGVGQQSSMGANV